MISFSLVAPIWVSLDGEEGQLPAGKVISASSDVTVLSFSLAGFYYEPVAVSGAVYCQTDVPTLTRLTRKGFPAFPKFAESIIISDRQSVSYEILSAEWGNP